MLKDPTEFRERFAKWKQGEQVYENGRALPEYGGGKNKFDTFAEQLSPLVYQELLQKKNVKNIDKAHDYMMRQLAMESDYGNSPVARKQHNYGGYGWNGKTYTTFKDDQQFVKAYVDLMTSRYIDAVNADTIQQYGHYLKKKGYHETPEDVYTSRLAGMKSMSGAVARHKTSNQGLYSLQSPMQSKVPYRNDDYNYYRANQYGKSGWEKSKQQQSISEWGSDWKVRTTPAGKSKVIQKWNATNRKPKPESSEEYTKRRIAEETKRTWLSDAADVAEGIKEAALSMTPYTAVPYFGAKVGQDVLNGNVGAQTALNAAFAAAPFMPKFVLPKLFNRTRPVADQIEKSPLENYIEKILANSNKYKIQHGTIDELFPEHANSVNDFMKYDVYPRFVDRDYGWFHDIVTDDVADIFGKNGVPKEIKFHTFFDPTGRYGGWRRGNDIYINVGTKRDISENLIHEIEHAQRGLIAKNKVIKSWHNPYLSDNHLLPMYTNNEKSFLKRGWPMTEDFINAEQIVPINEMGATNRETRFAISRLNGGMYGKDLDAFIDKMPNRELELYLSGGNGYARNVLSNFPIFNLTKQALKYVPTITIPLTTLRTNNTQNELRNK